MSTYNDITVGNDWKNILTSAGITSQTKDLYIQNKGSNTMVISFTETAPSAGSFEGIYLVEGSYIIVPMSAKGLFARNTGGATGGRLSIEDSDLILSSSSIPSDIFTNNEYGIRRLAVDSQQTSFEDNKQFRFVDEMIDLPFSTIVVYKIQLTYGINLFERKLSIYEGGRKYYVYPWVSDSEVTGTIVGTQRSPSPINTLLKDGLLLHPASGTTFTRYHATAFTPSGGTNSWLDVEHERTDGTANRATSEFSADSIRAGYAAGTQAWLVMPSIPTNGNTNGFIRLVWEERRNDY